MITDIEIDKFELIESTVIKVFKQDPDLIDMEMLAAYEALSRLYRAKAQAKNLSSKPRLNEKSQKLYQVIAQAIDQKLATFAEGDERYLEESKIFASCLRRLEKSVKMWTRKHGRQGYLKFICGFIK
ncbi:MAG: hypothetical protein R2880_16575 [Deinococcales bacterium]